MRFDSGRRPPYERRAIRAFVALALALHLAALRPLVERWALSLRTWRPNDSRWLHTFASCAACAMSDATAAVRSSLTRSSFLRDRCLSDSSCVSRDSARFASLSVSFLGAPPQLGVSLAPRPIADYEYTPLHRATLALAQLPPPLSTVSLDLSSIAYSETSPYPCVSRRL